MKLSLKLKQYNNNVIYHSFEKSYPSDFKHIENTIYLYCMTMGFQW